MCNFRPKQNSYEDFNFVVEDEEFEMKEPSTGRVKRLVRESSIMETNVGPSGIMHMTYWF